MPKMRLEAFCTPLNKSVPLSLRQSMRLGFGEQNTASLSYKKTLPGHPARAAGLGPSSGDKVL